MSDSLPDPECDFAEPLQSAAAAPGLLPAGPAVAGAPVSPLPPPGLPLMPLLKALGDPVRYRLLNEMANGEVLTIAGMARRLKAHPDTMGKHVKALRRAGILRRVKKEDADGRVKEFQIPAEFRVTAGVLDFGVCTVRLRSA